jgi:hypothetical protein
MRPNKIMLPSRTWFLSFLGHLVAIIPLLVVEPWILNLLVKFVSSCLESIKLQMPLMEMKAHQTIDAPDGDENDLQLWFP